MEEEIHFRLYHPNFYGRGAVISEGINNKILCFQTTLNFRNQKFYAKSLLIPANSNFQQKVISHQIREK